jgi:hypothetical protein
MIDPSHVPSPDDPEIVPGDTPCRKCQYNLRSLRLVSRCPECGTPVGLSIKGDFLCYSEPDWLESLRIGVDCMLGAVVVAIVAEFISEPGGRLAGLASTILFWLGAWFLTMPDPSGLGEDRYGTSRKVIRITLLFSMVSQAADMAEKTVGVSSDMQIYFQIITVLSAISVLVGQVAMLDYLRKLAERLPSHYLAARARFLMYGIAISYSTLEIAGPVLKWVAPGGRGGPRGGGGGFECVVALAGVAYILFFIMYLLMLRRLGKIFKSAEVFARITWSMAIAPL